MGFRSTGLPTRLEEERIRSGVDAARAQVLLRQHHRESDRHERPMRIPLGGAEQVTRCVAFLRMSQQLNLLSRYPPLKRMVENSIGLATHCFPYHGAPSVQRHAALAFNSSSPAQEISRFSS